VFWRGVRDWLTGHRHAQVALAMLRCTIGFVSVAFYVSNYSRRQFLFGASGLYSTDQRRQELSSRGAWSLFALWPEGWQFELLYLLGLVLALLVTIGFGGRLVLAGHWVMLWSLYNANPIILDGGDNFIIIATLFLLLTRCYDRLVFFRREPVLSARSVTVHNLGVSLLASQVSIIYLCAGFYKVEGSLWQDGTALYYILQVPEFYHPFLTPIIMKTDLALVVLSYAVVLVSVYFPLAVLFPQGRPFAVAVMVAFHVGIAIVMGLTSFALVMMAADLLFVSSRVEWGLDKVKMQMNHWSSGRVAA